MAPEERTVGDSGENGLRISVLADNRALPGFTAQWGLAMYIVMPSGEELLWDAGTDGAFLDNARKLGLRPARARAMALSHGHFDHAGGIAELAAEGYSGPIHAHPEVLTQRISQRAPGDPDVFPREIGVQPMCRGMLERLLAPCQGVCEILPGVRLITEIARRPGCFQAVDGFFLDEACTCPDHVIDDACLVLDGCTPPEEGPVVVLGCCHSGLANTLEHLREDLGIGKVHTLLGGMHLFKAGPEEWDQARNALRRAGVQRLHPGHCTGGIPEMAAGFAELEREGMYVEPLAVGQVIDFPSS